MLFLFNKAKIVSYIVSVFTVVALFAIANNFNVYKNEIQASTNPDNSMTENIDK